ncbi:MAG: methionine synthase [Phycisphaerales bacterium]|nr:methionine synthase [Phycisphaerales bacterium]
MPTPFLTELQRRVLIFDGAMGTSIHQVPLTVDGDYCGCENCTDILAKTRPDVIQTIHESFLAAGCDVVETDSFGASELVLAEFGIADQCRDLNRRAAEVARAACARFTTADKPRFVAGSMGPGTRLITLGNTDWTAMFNSYREQARGLLDGGVDAFIIETCQDLLQVKCAINSVIAALEERGKTPVDVPIMASVTIETTGTMLMGSSIEAVAAALAGYPIVSLGLNCATGPTEMTDHIRWLGRHWGAPAPGPGSARSPLDSGGRYISVMPNAGLPVLVEGRTEYPLKPAAFVEALMKFVEADGVNIIGGCCGTTPEHIRQLAEAVGSRPQRATIKSAFRPAVTSLYSPTEYRQDTSFLIVGERMNASGSKKFKQLLEVEDWDGVIALAKEQVRESAHVLDLNVDYAGRDNARDMSEIVRRVVRQVDAPLMLDSTQIATLEAGLRHAGGKCIINSANFEDGEEKFDRIMEMARAFGAGVVIGSIDEDKQASMARTAERKHAIAARAFRRATEKFGLDPADILFDPLVLPISTGMESDRRSALELVEGVRRIAADFPESQIVVGLSNVSFGLNPAARVVLNSALLHELVGAGLTAAIVHASKILPRNKIEEAQWAAAMDLIYDRRSEGVDPLQKFIELFKDVAGLAASAKRKVADTIEQRLRDHIIDGEKEGLKEALEEALKAYRPLDIINDHLLDGMKTVGELFGSGRMQLPFVLQSAEVMKMAVSQLEPLMERVEGQAKGTIVLATVKGDVHDIGKNLVDIILSNNGYKVINLGIKQPLPAILDAWKEHRADAIGMSGLLVKSVNVMEENIREMNSMGITAPVLLGGAALTRHYCESHLRGLYKGACYYGKDAFEGLATMDAITQNRMQDLNAQIEVRLGKRSNAENLINQTRIEKLARANAGPGVAVIEADRGATVRSDVAMDIPIPPAPFWGSRIVETIDLDEVFNFINPVALFRGQWQFKKGALSDAEYEFMLDDKVRPIFERLKDKCRADGLLRPKVAYGYFPCNAEGDDLIIWDPAGASGAGFQPVSGLRELERFRFPRQSDKRRLCISDFFRPIETGQVDVLGLHCVTMGHRASEASQALFKKNDYTEYLYLHGLSVEAAEGLAELWHKRMRQELGIAGDDSPRIRDLFTQKYRGSRYSFGYPACPELSDQEILFRLLRPDRIGCVLTENWQIDPEQSTSAIIVHHPEAKYFNV